MMDIDSAIATVPAFAGRELKAFRINGGITNINWRVVDEAAGETFFVKLHGAGTEQFIDRRTALVAAEIAAERGVGPQVLHYDEGTGVEVHEFLTGFRSCGIDDVQDDRVREGIMRAYKGVHDSLRLGKANTGLDQLDDFVAKTSDLSGRTPRDLDQLRWNAGRAGAAIRASGIDLVGCYNDSYISNYMRNAAGEIRIIDWEYAADNDAYWDIGMFGVESFFDDRRGVAALLEMYEGRAHEDKVARGYLYVGLAMLRWGLWAVYQSAHSDVPFDFAKYSRLLLLRARRQMLSADWDWALSRV
ncbi:choline/ethanolamine kinase family protein [Frigidibacter sp. MR17.24]|uniref:choline/ethanolamine kinase family protein n=1 Tax=Frigidibacter sp. MR17.24 TaxID=3127345 RepID=UPI0030130B49